MKAYRSMGMKLYTIELGQMTEMAVMPIYGKTFKIVLYRNNGPMALELSSIGYPGTTKIVQMMTGLTLTYFTAGSNMGKY